MVHSYPVIAELYKENEEAVPLWRGIAYARDDGDRVQTWFYEQEYVAERDYVCTLRFNSGEPAYYINIYNPSLLTLFKLRWS